MHSLRFFDARRRILLAMGVGPALASAACGGLVVFEREDGSSGQGGDGTTASSTVGTTQAVTTGMACQNPNALPTVCIPEPPGGCSPKEVPDTATQIATYLNNTCVPEDPEFCWCYAEVTNVLCGPTSEHGGDCCYVTDYKIGEMCEGRPFVVEGEARVADLAQRTDWSSAVGVGLADLSATDRSALAAAWARSGQFEHASVASFARVVLELLSLGAPSELVALAQRAAADEITHAELCFGIASTLSGAPVGPGPLPLHDAPLRSDAASIVYATVREGCLGETASALVAAAARDAATDPAIRAALERIAEDELRHAELAWRTVAWAIGAGVEGAEDAAAAAFTEPFSLEMDDLPGGASAEVARAYGVLSREEKRAVAARTFAEIVEPSRRALFAQPLSTPTGSSRATRFAMPAR
jgi:hypothetical protein